TPSCSLYVLPIDQSAMWRTVKPPRNFTLSFSLATVATVLLLLRPRLAFWLPLVPAVSVFRADLSAELHISLVVSEVSVWNLQVLEPVSALQVQMSSLL